MTTSEKIAAPGLFKMLLEGRAPWEFGATLATWPLMQYALRDIPRGDGHPVIVFPGLAASDFSTAPLRTFLHRIGYVPHGWHQGINLGPREGVVEIAAEQVLKVFQNTGEPVSLIGWSLGGIYARELAKQVPHAVRTVVTLGTPFAGSPSATNAWWLYQIANGKQSVNEAVQTGLKESPPVPTSSVYSKTDGIVAWQCSIQEAAHAKAPFENIELVASHFGIGFNALAWYVVADRLGQATGAWKPFDRTGMARYFYQSSPASNDAVAQSGTKAANAPKAKSSRA
jgi:pimeloyl-ACP methyl ester carboxylesterase